MKYRYPDSMILIFAKAPVPGTVKTRLIGKLNEQQAAELHKSMLIHSVNMALASELAPISLYCSPDTTHEVFQSLLNKHITLSQQRGDDLGSRMANAIGEALIYARNVVLIGSDCPVMDEAYLSNAFEKLENHETVIGPAEDGGYVLLGQNRLNQQMFEGINWGTSGVLNETRKQLQKQNADWYELDMLWDVDRPEDLERSGFQEYIHIVK